MRRFGLPVLPLIVAVIMGPLIELQCRRALQLASGSPRGLIGGVDVQTGLFALSPLCVTIYAIILIVLLWPLLYPPIKRRLGAVVVPVHLDTSDPLTDQTSAPGGGESSVADISAPGGAISLSTNQFTRVSGLPAVAPEVWLGASATLDTSGVSLINPWAVAVDAVDPTTGLLSQRVPRTGVVLDGGAARGGLAAHAFHRLGWRPDEHQPSGSAGAREACILGQESIAGVNCPCAGSLCCGDDPLAIQVALRGWRWADQKRLVGIGHVRRSPIGLAIDSNGAQT